MVSRRPTLGFIGAGQMATALARGIVANGTEYKAADILLSDPMKQQRDAAASSGFLVTENNGELMQKCDVVFLAVKPQYMESALMASGKDGSLSSRMDSILFVSIAAGISIQKLEEMMRSLGATKPRIVRVMPNVCCLVGASASAYVGNANCSKEDVDVVKSYLMAVGTAYAVPETLMDAVTGVSGSGPAYVFTIIEAMSDAGVVGGLPRDVARGLAIQTVLGAAKMCQDTQLHPMVLKDQVCSPAGTTIAGLAAMEEAGLRNAIMKGVSAAAARNKALGS